MVHQLSRYGKLDVLQLTAIRTTVHRPVAQTEPPNTTPNTTTEQTSKTFVRLTAKNHVDMQSKTMMYWGSHVVPLTYLEVIPIVWHGSSDEPVGSPPLTNFSVKHLLQTKTNDALLSLDQSITFLQIEWSMRDESAQPENLSDGQGTIQSDSMGSAPKVVGGSLWHGKEIQRIRLPIEPSQQPQEVPIFWLPSSDPMARDPIPCVLQGYATTAGRSTRQLTLVTNVAITASTLVRILPPQWALPVSTNPNGPLSNVSSCQLSASSFYQSLLGENGQDFLTKELQEEVLSNHNPDTIRELTLRMSMQCSRPIQIGTTKDAFLLQKAALSRRQEFQHFLQSRNNNCQGQLSHYDADVSTTDSTAKTTKSTLAITSPPLWNPTLLVHSPHHADGKTMLVQAIAQTMGCFRIHIIRPGPLLAKYGIHADVALESLLHGILVSAAAVPSSAPICIILDHVDAMMPPLLSGKSGAGAGGDAAIPIFNAIASYLRTVAVSMQRSNEFPFPLKNPFYNVGGTGGTVMTVRFCLVGIVTCPDDGWRSLQREANTSAAAGGNSTTTILDVLVGGRYRLPTLTAATRWSAFSKAMERSKTSIVLDEAAKKRLSILAASAAWAKGSAFQKVASLLAQKQEDRTSIDELSKISVQDLDDAFATVQRNFTAFAHVTFEASPEDSNNNNNINQDDLFASVGGNIKAKRSLEDALAIDPEKRRMLARFGMSPPTGILLYGPPGCGKTLLAKAVARLLKSPGKGTNTDSALPLGGTFISLGSSDLVRAEIGTSEKMLVSAFEFADKNAPSVIFLDEFQALFIERSRGGSGKLASTLLQCLDDIQRWKSIGTVPTRSIEDDAASCNRVVVLGATNTPWMVDSAFLRPGRFDRVVHVGLPTLNERESILKVHTSRMKIRDKADPQALQKLCQEVAKRTTGFSGADLAALCRAAAIRALASEEVDCWIEDKHFFFALDTDVTASSDSTLVGRLENWKP